MNDDTLGIMIDFEISDLRLDKPTELNIGDFETLMLNGLISDTFITDTDDVGDNIIAASGIYGVNPMLGSIVDVISIFFGFISA